VAEEDVLSSLRPRRYHQGMRSLLAALLLFLQFQPLAGAALCWGLSRADAGRMENGCPMPANPASENANPGDHAMASPSSADAARASASRSAGPALQGPIAASDCAFAQACTPTTPPVLATPAVIAAMDSPHHTLWWRAESALGTERSAPPLPPPNA
jgi:hypothetical protein